jgi:hypothetical protein
LLRYYDRRRALAARLAAHRDDPAPTLSVVVAPERLDDEVLAGLARVRDAVPAGTRVIVVSTGDPQASGREDAEGTERVAMPAARLDERLAEGVRRADGAAIAFIQPGARPSDTWAEAALGLLRDPGIGAVVGPAVPQLGGSPLADAAGILSESRMGAGGARVRSHVGGLREVDDFPATNLFIRADALRRALADGVAFDGRLCEALRRDQGLAVMCHPEAAVTARPSPLFRPRLAWLYRLGAARGREVRLGHLRIRHLAPTAFVLFLAAGPVALLASGPWPVAWTAVLAAYACALLAVGLLTVVLHRRWSVAALVMAGAAASHIAFGAGMLRGALERLSPWREQAIGKAGPRSLAHRDR